MNNINSALGSVDLVDKVSEWLRTEHPNVGDDAEYTRWSLVLYHLALGIASPVGCHWADQLPPVSFKLYEMRVNKVHDPEFYAYLFTRSGRDPRAVVQGCVPEEYMEDVYRAPGVFTNLVQEIRNRIVDKLIPSDLAVAVGDYTLLVGRAMEISTLIRKSYPELPMLVVHALDRIDSLGETTNRAFTSAAEVEDYSNRALAMVHGLVDLIKG